MAEIEEVAVIEDQDDLGLVKKMQEGRDQMVAEIKKVIIFPKIFQIRRRTF